MPARFFWLSAAALLALQAFAGSPAAAQAPATEAASPAATPANEATAPDRGFTKREDTTGISNGDGTLPRTHGQVWREYDIRPYTARLPQDDKPQQAIIDWILRETGTDVWFSEPLGLLSADRETLRVYHTPEIQDVVRDIYFRFRNSDAESNVFGLRLVTIDSPNWRSRALPLMQPVNVQSAGVDAWLLSKENAAVLFSELSKRTDFQEHSTPDLLVQNGQSHTISRRRPRTYIRSIGQSPAAWPGQNLEMGQIEEGFMLQVSPLLSLDGSSVDAVIKCDIDQVERLVPIPIDIPSPVGQQRVQIQVPQLVSWRLHERFRWPTDQVLLLSCGVVATPGPQRSTILGVPNPLATGPGRADALLFIESKGRVSQAVVVPQRTATAPGTVRNNRGRY